MSATTALLITRTCVVQSEFQAVIILIFLSYFNMEMPTLLLLTYILKIMMIKIKYETVLSHVYGYSDSTDSIMSSHKLSKWIGGKPQLHTQTLS